MRCAIYGCNADNQSVNKDVNIMFFRFPLSDNNLLNAWRKACCRDDNFNTKNARICSRHFDSSDYARNLQQEYLGYTTKSCRKLKPEAVPSKNIPKANVMNDASVARYQRTVKRNQSKFVDEIMELR